MATASKKSASKTTAPGNAAAKKAAPAKSPATKAAPKKPAAEATKAEAPAAAPAPKALRVGDPAPAFELLSDSGEKVRLSDFRGQKVVLYFYPKDATPGCTQEACDFQANLHAIAGKGGVVLGVSRDGVASHARFKAKQGLAFPLLSDPDAAVHEAYGAWGEKVFMGRRMTGALRSTFVIDAAGLIQAAYPKVSVKGHVVAVVAAL
jgi:peroxiredoxin Q/BCP